MRLRKTILAAVLAMSVAAPPALAVTIDLGGVRVRLPTIVQQRRTYTTQRDSRYATHPRWATVAEGSYRMATNGQGIWVGYDDQGSMVMQLELPNPAGAATGSPLAVQVEINGRFYRTVTAAVANEHLAIVRGAEVEAILGRLMSGRTIAVMAGPNRLETHLTGSSAAIREVRNAAALQARLFVASGSKPAGQATGEKPAVKDEDVTQYYLPGVEGLGEVDVRFDIREGEGLVIYMNFEQFEGHGAPTHSIALNVTETGRAVALLRKAEEWSGVAKSNRVGLFSKRIGFIDDALASLTDVEEPKPSASGSPGISQKAPLEASPGATAAGPSPSLGEGVGAAASARKSLPKDFRSVNFNSYETGDTGVQIEHSVAGFSRRFNLSIDEALELADFLEATVEVRSQEYETRGLSEEDKEQLFR